LTLDWLFDEGSLTRRLTGLSSDSFSVTPLCEGWQPLRDDECAALDLPQASIGWVREVYLRGHGQPWVFARSVASRSALQGDGLHMDELGSRSLASCCSATAPSRAGRSRSAITRAHGCPPRISSTGCGRAARGSIAGR
jgi:chorismate-pyruvate lyase